MRVLLIVAHCGIVPPKGVRSWRVTELDSYGEVRGGRKEKQVSKQKSLSRKKLVKFRFQGKVFCACVDALRKLRGKRNQEVRIQCFRDVVNVRSTRKL